MGRKRDPKRDKAKEMYIVAEGDIKLVDIAQQLGIPEGSVRGWKAREKWQDELNVTLHNKKRNATKKTGAPYGNKNASGHGAPKRNKNAVKHGLFLKYLPEEACKIAQGIIESNPIDILWENIIIQYTAIIRAQRIMLVNSKDDLTRELKKEKEFSSQTGDGWEKEYNLQFAWDKQASFLQAQARAMTSLAGMIKRYEELCTSGLATEEQKARIEKIKAEVQAIKSNKEQRDQTIEVISNIPRPGPESREGDQG